MQTIESENFILRKAESKDLEPIFKNIWSDENISKYMFWQPSKTYSETKDRLYRTIEYQRSNLAYFVCLKDTDEAIGFGGIKEVKPNVYAESGLCITSKYQGLGYGKELLSALLDLAFNKLNASEFIYESMSNNEKSKNLCLHFGFQFIESRKEVRSWDNYECIIEKYSLKRENYIKI